MHNAHFNATNRQVALSNGGCVNECLLEIEFLTFLMIEKVIFLKKQKKTPGPSLTQRTWAVTIQRRTGGRADVNADYLFWVIMI